MDRHSETGLKLIKSSHYVEDSVVTNEPDLGPRLDEDFAAGVALWRASQPPEGDVTAPTFSNVLLILKDRLAVSRRRLAKADRVHVENVRHFLEVRVVAQKDNATVFSKMGATRRTFEEHFPGSEDAFVLGGFQSPTSRDSTQLLEQSGSVLERLKSPDFVLPEPLTKAVKVDAKELVAELDADVECLRTSDGHLRLARREVQKSRKNKNRAVKEHGKVFVWIVRALENLYLLAGEEELAKQIRPSGHRPGRRAVEVSEEDAAKQESAGAPTSGGATSDSPPAGESEAGQPAADPPVADQQAAGEPVADQPDSGEATTSAGASVSSDSDAATAAA